MAQKYLLWPRYDPKRLCFGIQNGVGQLDKNRDKMLLRFDFQLDKNVRRNLIKLDKLDKILINLINDLIKRWLEVVTAFQSKLHISMSHLIKLCTAIKFYQVLSSFIKFPRTFLSS